MGPILPILCMHRPSRAPDDSSNRVFPDSPADVSTSRLELPTKFRSTAVVPRRIRGLMMMLMIPSIKEPDMSASKPKRGRVRDQPCMRRQRRYRMRQAHDLVGSFPSASSESGRICSQTAKLLEPGSSPPSLPNLQVPNPHQPTPGTEHHQF